MQLVWQRVEDWGWDDPPHCRPLVLRGSSQLQLHTVIGHATWTPVEAGQWSDNSPLKYLNWESGEAPGLGYRAAWGSRGHLFS